MCHPQMFTGPRVVAMFLAALLPRSKPAAVCFPRPQMFTGPPENVRDHVMAATKSLMRGQWRKAHSYVCSLNVWNLVPQKEAVGDGCFLF